MRLRDLAAARVRYGYRRLHVLLRREGWPVNHKRTYRLYAEEGLAIRSKLPRRKRAWRYRQGRPGAAAPAREQVPPMDPVFTMVERSPIHGGGHLVLCCCAF